MYRIVFLLSGLACLVVFSCNSVSEYQPLSEVMKGLPQHIPSFKTDDYIIAINGQDTKGMHVDSVSNLLLSLKYQDIELTVKQKHGEARKDSIKSDDWVNKILPLTCLRGDCENGNGIALVDEHVYKGAMQKGKPHGKGRSEYKTILEVYYYEGDWENGLYHGIGKLNNGDGYYEGGFLNGEKSGLGKLITTNATCEGTFWNNHMRRGTIKFQNENAMYTGETINDKPEGVGKKIYADGKTFEGIWDFGKFVKNVDASKYGCVRGDCFNGEGKYVWAQTGFIYEGIFQNYRLVKGKITYTPNEWYEGELQEGKFHGNGTLHLEDGTVYGGKFENHQFVSGKAEYAESIYEGNFVDYIPDGKGKATPKNTQTTQSAKRKYPYYDGESKDGVMHGNGKIVYENGDYIEGAFENDKIVRLKSIKSKDFHLSKTLPTNKLMSDKARYLLKMLGWIQEGCIEGNCDNGYGIKIRNGSLPIFIMLGNFKNGELNGEGEKYQYYGDELVATYKGAFKNGKWHGYGQMDNVIEKPDWETFMYHEGIYYEGKLVSASWDADYIGSIEAYEAKVAKEDRARTEKLNKELAQWKANFDREVDRYNREKKENEKSSSSQSSNYYPPIILSDRRPDNTKFTSAPIIGSSSTGSSGQVSYWEYERPKERLLENGRIMKFY